MTQQYNINKTMEIIEMAVLKTTSTVITAVILSTFILFSAISCVPEKTSGLHSNVRIVKDGHGKDRDMAILAWHNKQGKEIGMVRTVITGVGRTGPASVELFAAAPKRMGYNAAGNPNYAEWDTREWQWWKGFPLELVNQDRPRNHSTTTGGADTSPGGVRVWSQFNCDDVLTTQEWFFDDLEESDVGVYDCILTIQNNTKKTLEEYGQFFASYTIWNTNGHYYWSSDGQLINYFDRTGDDLNYYVVAKDSPFEKLGQIPHCPRGEGKVGDTWKHPVSISKKMTLHDFDSDYRHIIMTEEYLTAGIGSGMNGKAQDYIIYPPSIDFKPGEVLKMHVRHLIVPATQEELPEKLEKWWQEFTNDHERIHSLSRPVP
jgi:hypothetical protein